jgi:hypothetical protein
MLKNLTTRQSTPRRAAVKYLVGLRLALAGIHQFEDVAVRIGVTGSAISQVLSGQRRTPRIQRAIADLCGCRPVDCFGELTHRTLIGVGLRTSIDVRDRLRQAGIRICELACFANMPSSTARSLLDGRRRSLAGQLRLLMAFRRLTHSNVTWVDFWGALAAPGLGIRDCA